MEGRRGVLPFHVVGLETVCNKSPRGMEVSAVVVEVKAEEGLLPIHQAQLLTYMKLGGWKVGLIINFHESLLKNGIKRLVLGLTG